MVVDVSTLSFAKSADSGESAALALGGLGLRIVGCNAYACARADWDVQLLDGLETADGVLLFGEFACMIATAGSVGGHNGIAS